jgi:hypothetical protein
VKEPKQGIQAQSWVDRLTDGIDRLPGPTWLAYLAAFVALLLIDNAAGWIDGYLPIGSFDPYLSSLAGYALGGLAAIHYLDRETRIALDRFRPALSMADDEFLALRHDLTTLPARATILWSLVGLAIALAYATDSTLTGRGSASVAVDIATALIGTPMLVVLLFHTVRQLRQISHIQSDLANVDLFQLDPLLAFSGVTARTGVIILGLAYLVAAPEPAPLERPALIAWIAISIMLSIAIFVLPLYGMHQRLAREKARLKAIASSDLQAALAEVTSQARIGERTKTEELNHHLSNLIVQRDVLAGIPTWPWEPTTVRGFSTAVLLPIALWLVFRVFEEFFR